MGRPLKIAKATLMSVTATTAATNTVTVAENLNSLGIVRGNRFQLGTNTGNLIAGTTYWVLRVVDANNFTVSETDTSANITNNTFILADATVAPDVVASVESVDTGFNNLFGVVGGNKGIIGKQLSCNVAIGQVGAGSIFAATNSKVVTGFGTDFANVASGTQIYLSGNGVSAPVLLGTTTSTAGNITVAVANTTVTGNVIGTSGNAQTLTVNAPVVFDSAFGGLTAGTTYWVKSVANASAFTVSYAPGGAPVALTANASVSGNALQNQIELVANAAAAAGLSGTGDSYAQVVVEPGYIVRQKGKSKYLVKGVTSGLVGAVFAANVAPANLTINTMSMVSTAADASTAFVASVSDHNARVFSTEVAATALVTGTEYTITSSGDTDWSAVGAASNSTGVTFVATATGTGTGTAIVSNSNPDVIPTTGTAYAANTFPGQTNPVVTIESE